MTLLKHFSPRYSMPKQSVSYLSRHKKKQLLRLVFARIMSFIDRLRISRIGFKKQEILQRKPSNEVFAQLSSLSGKKLLESKPIKEVVSYASNWQPFLSNISPKVTPDDPLSIHPETNAFELPFPFISPSTKETTDTAFWGNAQFDWDTYFVNKALTTSKDPKLVEIAKGQVENLIYLLNRLDYIPNASKLSIANRTQIPFLTGMILDVYKETGDKEWLQKAALVAKREYENWMSTDEQLKERGLSRPSHRISKNSLLIRPAGRDILTEHYPAAANTGQDDSAQWARRAFDYSPVGLNCAMYKYESDFARIADILNNPVDKAQWESVAQQRKEQINSAYWNDNEGTYFDEMYDRDSRKWVQDTAYYSLTSFMPLWVGLATSEQADRQTQQLHHFESPYGLMIGSKDNLISHKTIEQFKKNRAFNDPKLRRYKYRMMDLLKPEQWDYPNIWAPIAYFAVDGLIRYEKRTEAQRVLESSLRGLASFYAEKKTLPEKLKGTNGTNGDTYNYPNQEGYGWTNAFVLIAYNRLSALENITNQVKQAYATIAS